LGVHSAGAFPNGESTNPSGCDIMHQLFFRSSLGWIGNFRAEDDSFSLNLRVIRRARSGARPVFQIKRLRGRDSHLDQGDFDVSRKANSFSYSSA
jgi:hypothetical protein